jgi:hypothetical protein
MHDQNISYWTKSAAGTNYVCVRSVFSPFELKTTDYNHAGKRTKKDKIKWPKLLLITNSRQDAFYSGGAEFVWPKGKEDNWKNILPRSPGYKYHSPERPQPLKIQ